MLQNPGKKTFGPNLYFFAVNVNSLDFHFFNPLQGFANALIGNQDRAGPVQNLGKQRGIKSADYRHDCTGGSG